MKKNLISACLVVAVALALFFSDFRVGIFNYKDVLTDTRGKQYNIYEDKSGFKVLEPVQDKHNFVIRIIPNSDYLND
jgi:hypothetical protein